MPANGGNPGLSFMIGSLPRRLVWILCPRSSVAASFEERIYLWLRQRHLVCPRVTFRQTQMIEKLNQNSVFAFSVDLRGDASFVGDALLYRCSKKLFDLLLVVAQRRGDPRTEERGWSAAAF